MKLSDHTRTVTSRALARGFSLLELLIALTILAIVLVPVAYFYTKSLQVAEQAGIRTRALMLARERIGELKAIPYEMLATNVQPVDPQKLVYGPNGLGLLDFAACASGYDFESATGLHPAGQWASMFRYPLPMDFNPYNPYTMGYDNTPGANHDVPNNPTGDQHVNFNALVGDYNGGLSPLDYEYEPVGFYGRVYGRNSGLSKNNPGPPYLPDAEDIRMADARTITGVEPGVADGRDFYRTGYDQQVDNYAIYGRRTIIMDLYPPLPPGQGSPVQDTDGDQYTPDRDADGGATAVNPYPLAKGPDNKFEQVSRFGPGKLVTVQVFWLPRKAPDAYIPWEDLNKVELKTFIAPSGSSVDITDESGTAGVDKYIRLGFDPRLFDISPATIAP